MREQYERMMELYESLKTQIRCSDKYLYERWKAGGFLVDSDIVSIYPTLEECVDSLEVIMTCQENRLNKLAETIRKSGEMYVSPLFSVFSVSAIGNYTLLYMGTSSSIAARFFLDECLRLNSCGVEVRTNGMRIDI